MNTVKRIAPCLFAAAVLTGCSASSGHKGAAASARPAPPRKAVRLTLLAVDRSKSTEGIRSQLLATTFDIATNFDPARDDFRMYRFGHSIEEVYSQLPDDDDDFGLALIREVKASDPVAGTNYSRVAETLAAAAAAAREPEIRIVIAGDGGNDLAGDPASEKRYRAAARLLARNRRVLWVRFWGVDVGAREEVRSVWRPLGDRLQILSLDQNPLAP